MPRPLLTPVSYPPGASGGATVLLELTVRRDGSVSDPVVLEGSEPFATSARSASLSWRFVPARRAGHPLATRIRFLVRFEQVEQESHSLDQTAVASGSRSARSTPGKPLPEARSETRSAPREERIEVVVHGERVRETRVTLSRAEVEQLPGAFGDPFRAIESLPGVTPLLSGVPFFFVRGAPPGNQGFFVDGVRVPLLYHLALGPGVIHPALVQETSLYPGGYPARYGRFVGGIVALQTEQPSPEWHAQGTVRLVDSGGLVSGPLPAGSGGIAAGGRYSYTAAILSLIVPELTLEYWDYQLRSSYPLTRDTSLGVLAFGARDLLTSEEADEQYLAGTEFHRLDFRYDRAAGRQTRARLGATVGIDRTRMGEGEQSPREVWARSVLFSARGELEHQAGQRLRLRTGADLEFDRHRVEFRSRRLATAMPSRNDWAGGLWADLVLRPEAWLEVVPGLRLDGFHSDGASAVGVDPRLGSTFKVTRRLRILHAFGVAHQAPSFLAPVPGVQPAGLDGGLQSSVQTSAGVELDLPASTTASLNLFQNAFFNLTDQISLLGTRSNQQLELLTRSRGHAAGLELLLRRPVRQGPGGFLAYTLSRSVRSLGTFHGPAAFDRTHVLQLGVGHHLGRGWRVAGRLVYYTGIPPNRQATVTQVPPTSRPEPTGGEEEGARPAVSEEARQAGEAWERTPPFYRIDLRVDKRWAIGSSGANWGLVLEVLNLTLNREVVERRQESDGWHEERIGPVTVPSLGVEVVL